MTPENSPSNNLRLSSEELSTAAREESEKFQEYYRWLENAMPRVFFEEVSKENLMLIAHSLIGFNLQDYFSTIKRKTSAIGLCLDSPDADLQILRSFTSYGIKNYQSYVSKEPVPFPGVTCRLRVATLEFTEAVETSEKCFPLELKNALRGILKKEFEELTDEEFEACLAKMNTRFLLALPLERLSLAVKLLFINTIMVL